MLVLIVTRTTLSNRSSTQHLTSYDAECGNTSYRHERDQMSNSETGQGALWGARFASQPADELRAISKSPDYYFRLFEEDLRGCKAHCRELGRVGLLSEKEVELLNGHLDEMNADWINGDLTRDDGAEDVHGFIEQELVKRAGDVGGKLRAGRSRNDQTANDLKLFMIKESYAIGREIAQLARSLTEQAKQHTETPCPGFTHLQVAQPVTFGHQLMAHVQPLMRDMDRLASWRNRHSTSPLGAAALAGSGITENTEEMARDLGYERAFANSIDAVGARDHASEFVYVLTQLMIHISRLSEEQILWASQQFGWVGLDDGWSTGSSIMPQKKNPDIAELSRGKSGTMLGLLTGILAIQKNLPFAYNRDLFEDKNTVLQSVDLVHLVLPALSGSIRTMQVNSEVMREQATWGYSMATDVADKLSLDGVPFRNSHEIVGALVRACEEKGIDLPEVDKKTLEEIDQRLDEKFISSLTPERSMDARSGRGSTRPDRVGEQINAVLENLDSFVAEFEGEPSRTSFFGAEG